MFKYLFILLTLFIPLHSAAQNCTYAGYYQLTDLAKKKTSEKKYKEANQIFKDAFSEVPFPLGHDLSVALYVANQTKDSEWEGFIAKRLAMGGIPFRYFRKFRDLEWFEEFKIKFPDYADYYRNHFNSELRNRFIELSQRDSDFNKKYHLWREGKIELTLQELIKGATEIVSDFKDMHETHGFPYEEKMGYNYVRNKNRIEQYPILPLFVHIYQRGEIILQNNIHDIVCNGGLHPSYEVTLNNVSGFGNNKGVEQEMKARYAEFGNKNK